MINEVTHEQVVEAWLAYDSQEDRLRRFIQQTPVARIAHDAAVSAMNQGDEHGRSSWEGYLRALFLWHFLESEGPESSSAACESPIDQ